jgi:hypothetical protein
MQTISISEEERNLHKLDDFGVAKQYTTSNSLSTTASES